MVDMIFSLEATCDLPEQIIKENDFRIIHMDYYVNGEEFSTAMGDASASGLYEKMAKGAKTSTTQINATLYEEFFTELIKEGKPIFHIGFSSGLSGSLNQAYNAINAINGDGDKKIYVIDTLCGCSGQGLLAIIVKKFAETANSIQEVIDYAEKMKWNIAHSYTVDTFKYLSISGRLNSVSAFIGNILNIKPVMRVDNEGRLDLCKKVLSRKKAMRAIADGFAEKMDPEFDTVIIAHALCLSDAEYLAELLKEKADVKVYITNLGPIIGSHSGPGTLSMYYVSSCGR